MIFLSEPDFEKQIKADVLQSVISANPTYLDEAELASIAEMSSYLNTKYDVAAIFNPANRNSLVVMYLIDIMLYHLHARIAPRQIPELRGIRYEAAIKWLEMVAKGTILPDLPLLPDQNTPGTISWTGQHKRINNF